MGRTVAPGTGWRGRAARRLRWSWWWTRDRGVVVTTWLAMRLLPARPTAVVHGWPDWEGNAVEVVRGLVRRYPGTVYWLREDGGADAGAATVDAPAGRVVGIRANTLRAVLVSWSAEVTFFTHGLVTAVPPPRSRLVVNVWHGDGPKRAPSLPRCRSTVAVAATRLWGLEKARLFSLRAEDVAVVGNPRIDSALARPVQATRRLLGLPAGGDRLVVWLPTFRRGWDGRHDAFVDADPLSRTVDGRLTVPPGVRLVVKPHPLDTDDYSATGARVVRDEHLSAAGVTLPQLLAVADALLSDASSAWVDYLAFDRPIGFFLPDLDQYGEQRGYNVPDVRAVLPGPVLRDRAEVARFLVDVRDGRVGTPSSREELGAIGYDVRLPVTDHLLDWLDAYQRARGSRPLFSQGGGGDGEETTHRPARPPA